MALIWSRVSKEVEYQSFSKTTWIITCNRNTAGRQLTYKIKILILPAKCVLKYKILKRGFLKIKYKMLRSLHNCRSIRNLKLWEKHKPLKITRKLRSIGISREYFFRRDVIRARRSCSWLIVKNTGKIKVS